MSAKIFPLTPSKIASERSMSRIMISVVMPVYNAQRYISASIQSILDQTESSFELVIVDDGSVDDTVGTVSKFSDQRIRLLRIAHVGIVGALNFGCRSSHGTYIARMDADDLAYPERLHFQLGMFERRGDIDVLCTDVDLIDEQGNVIGHEIMGDVDSESIKRGLLFESGFKPIIHPSVMMRRKVYEDLGGYRDYAFAEDYDFWLRALGAHKIVRSHQKVLKYRRNSQGISQSNLVEQLTSTVLSLANYHAKIAYGSDFYSEARPALFAVREDLYKMIGPIAKFINLKNAFRSAIKNPSRRNVSNLFVEAARLRRWHYLLPGGQRRAFSQAAIEVAHRLCAAAQNLS